MTSSISNELRIETNDRLYRSRMSDSEEVIRKPKSANVIDSNDDESDKDETSEKTNGFVDHSHSSKNSSKSLSSNSHSDKKPVKNATKIAIRSSPAKSKPSDKSDDEGRSQSRKSDSSSDRSRSRSRSRKSSSSDRSRSRSRSRKSSSSSNRSRSRSRSRKSSSSSNRSRSNSRSRKSSNSSNRSRSNSRSRKSSSSSGRRRSGSRSRKSSSSSSRTSSRSRSRKSDSSIDQNKESPAKKSNSPGAGSHRSRKSDSSDDDKRFRKKSSSDDEGLSQASKKSVDSDDQSQSQSNKPASSEDEIKSRSRARKSDSSEDEIKSQSRAKKFRKNKIRSRKLDSSDDENQSVSSKTSKPHSDESSESEIESQPRAKKSKKRSRIRSAKFDSSDDENQSKNLDSGENLSVSPKGTPQESNNHVQKSGGKFSLITESDLESEKDDRPMVNESASDDSSSQMNKKSKKLHKRKSTSGKKSSKLKSNGQSELPDWSESDNEERSSLKRVQKSTAKRKSDTKPEKGSKSSKKEKDPLLSIRSETQRMIREGRISLPYHQPKQHTLHEFLQRRRTAPSMPLKATSEVLKTVCEQLTIKQKEVEEFYKSESDYSDTEPQTDLPATTATEEVNGAAKEAESTSTDPIVENNEPSVEMDHEDDLDTTLVNNDANESPPSIVSDHPAQTENPTELIDADESKQPDENKNPNEPVETVIPEQDTFEFIIANGSNLENTPEDDQIKPMDVDTDPPTLKTNEPVTKPNEAVEKPLPDSVDFSLEIQDSCNIDTDEFIKPNDKPESKLIQDSDDFVLSLEDSPVKDTETDTNQKEITEPVSKPVINKDLMKNRIETLLLTRNIKLSSIKLNSTPESIQFEIPSYRQEPSGIHELKAKFVKHSMAKKKPKPVPSHLNITTTQTNADGEITGITKESLTLGLNDEEDEFADPKYQAPGAKHAYLKKKMLDMLISKKEATWNEYQNEKRKYYGSDSDADIDDEIDYEDSATCKKLNFEPYHPEDEPDDDELIEDDVVYEEKTRDKNCYLDEEAEVSDDEDDEFENPTVPEEDDSADSDGLDFKDDSPAKPATVAETSGIGKLFNYNTTGSDLENKLLGLESISQPNSPENISTSEIMDLCSGTFTTQDPSKCNNAVADAEDDDFFVDDSQNISLTLPDTDNMIENSADDSKKDAPKGQNDELDDEDEEIIVRKKPTMRIVEDSDDEAETTEPTNEADENISDDDSAANDDQDDEFINDDEIEDELGPDEVEAEEFGYNSEEELVTYDKAAVRGFLENEAELSGSEWGSEDENERDLDVLEKEAGDDDDIDADALKEELGKIHMRQLLDDDQHDVRMLKEMLLEDGELHSDVKRQRKFQWKNLADGDDFFKNHNYDSDDEILNDDENDESEEHWRKIRHERETFLSQQEHKKSMLSETTVETVESSFIQLTTSTKIVNENITAKIVQRATSANSISSKDKPSQELPKNNPKFNCGSFLSRGKLLLSKMSLAVTDSKGNINRSKNGKNFVFGAKSPEKEPVSVSLDNPAKRKFNSSLPSVTKRKKLIVENVTPGATSILARLALSEEL